MEFSIWKALLITAFYITISFFYALYTTYVVEKRVLGAANVSGAIYGLFAVGTIIFTREPIYIVFVVLGSWLGTFWVIKRMKK